MLEVVVPLTPMVVDCVTFDRAPLGRRGYNEDQVDDFLDRMQATLEGKDNLTAQDVRYAEFDPAPFIRRGYHEGQVDEFLDLVVEELTRREGGQPTAPPTGPTNRPAALNRSPTAGRAAGCCPAGGRAPHRPSWCGRVSRFSRPAPGSRPGMPSPPARRRCRAWSSRGTVRSAASCPHVPGHQRQAPPPTTAEQTAPMVFAQPPSSPSPSAPPTRAQKAASSPPPPQSGASSTASVPAKTDNSEPQAPAADNTIGQSPQRKSQSCSWGPPAFAELAERTIGHFESTGGDRQNCRSRGFGGERKSQW